MLGHSLDDLAMLRSKIGGTTLGQVGNAMTAKYSPMANMATRDIYSLAKGVPGLSARNAAKISRFAGRAMPLVSAGVVAMDLADIATNETSLLNKGMDATAMGVGATIGGILGGPAAPLTAMYGASIGKAASDGLQFLFGDKKSPKQRELENALAQLNAGRIG